MKDGERGWPIENYGKKEQKEWLDNTLPEPHPCTAGNKEEEHIAKECFNCMNALETYLGRKRIMTSPSPVAAAPPTLLSTYAPAPMIGESPMRLQEGPFLVKKSPVA